MSSTVTTTKGTPVTATVNRLNVWDLAASNPTVEALGEFDQHDGKPEATIRCQSLLVGGEQFVQASTVPLTDAERGALAYIGYHGDVCMTVTYRLAETEPMVDSPTLQSLIRFGLVQTRYERHRDPDRRPKVYDGRGYVYALTGLGLARHQHNHSGVQSRCCEWTVLVECVCAESTACPNPSHHGGCRGTHD